MTLLQKTLVTVTVAVLAAAGIYETFQVAQLREQNQTLRQELAPLAEQIRQLEGEFAEVTNRLANLRAENSRLKSNPHQLELLKLRREVAVLKDQVNQTNDPTQSAAKSLLDRVNLLKQRLAQNPAAGIPELKLLSEADWLSVAKDWPLNSDYQYRIALSRLRSIAESKFGNNIGAALKKYLGANGGKFPTDLGQLQGYFSEPVDSAMLDRWQIVPGQTSPGGAAGDGSITPKSAVDDAVDSRIIISQNGNRLGGYLNLADLDPVYQAYFDANPNADGHGLARTNLLPYAKTPEQRALIQKFIDENSLRQEMYWNR